MEVRRRSDRWVMARVVIGQEKWERERGKSALVFDSGRALSAGFSSLPVVRSSYDRWQSRDWLACDLVVDLMVQIMYRCDGINVRT